MEQKKDTGLEQTEQSHADDPQKTGSGHPAAPGGAAAPEQNTYEMTQGQEGYPGPRPGGEESKTSDTPAGDTYANREAGDTPPAGDVDPSSTASSEQTGQQGDPDKPEKNKANPWNG